MNYQFDLEQNQHFLAEHKIAIVVANFYQDIAQSLLDGSIDTLKKYGSKNDNIDVFYVPGAFEVPLMAKKLAQQNYSGIITLGAVIQGETPHFDFICQSCAKGVARVGYDYQIAISFGILTTHNKTQAIARAGGGKGNKGQQAALAMMQMLYLLGK